MIHPSVCVHLNPKKSKVHPGLLVCKDCGLQFFDDDRLEYTPRFRTPKGFWKQTAIFTAIALAIATAAFIIRGLILYY